MKTFYFLIGLPRSGSTVLSSLLNQHPDVYVTPTSPLLDLLIAVQNEWHRNPAVIANPDPEQLTRIVQAIINSTWSHRQEPVIIDRCRGWGKNLPSSTILFQKEIKCILTIRDLPSIMASWLTLMENNPGNFMDRELKTKNMAISRINRVMGMWYYMVKDCVDCIECAYRTSANQIYTVHYDDLIDNPHAVLNSIETFLDLRHTNYDIHHIQNNDEDQDLKAWGLSGLHTIRPQLSKTSKHPKDILGSLLFNHFQSLDQHHSRVLQV